MWKRGNNIECVCRRKKRNKIKIVFGLLLFEKNMSLEVLAEQQQLQQTTPFFNAELINKYSKYVKTIGKRVVEGLL